MNKYKRYKNRLEMFLASDKGKRVLNFFYSWGASIVILGAMFKILHLPYGEVMLAVGMTTEFFVFFIFGFEKPHSEYHWEDVFPALKSKNPMDKPNVSINGGMLNELGKIDSKQKDEAGVGVVTPSFSISSEEAATSKDMTEVTKKYASQMELMVEQMEKFTYATQSLTKVSENLSGFYDSMSGESDSILNNSKDFIQQMENLNRNVAGLNTIYEIQLRSISSQIDNIEHINAGLNRIKEMYDGSIVDSSVFKRENERLAEQLSQLNQVYARMLQAMTVNMHGGGYSSPTSYNSDNGMAGNKHANI